MKKTLGIIIAIAVILGGVSAYAFYQNYVLKNRLANFQGQMDNYLALLEEKEIQIDSLRDELRVAKNTLEEQEEKIDQMQGGMVVSPLVLTGDNAVFVKSGEVGSQIVEAGFVLLKEPGFLVIHKDDEGKPGAVIGSSELLSKGRTDDFTIELSESLQEGDYYGMLHFDDGDEEFNLANDQPVRDDDDNIILMKFIASLEE